MKVLVFTSHYPEQNAPTRAIYNRYTFEELSRMADLRVVCPKPWWGYVAGRKLIPRVYHEDTYGIPAAYVTYWSIPRMTFLHGIAMYASLRRYMKKMIREDDYDIVLSTWAYPDCMAAVFFARMAGCPLVTVVLGSDINELAGRKLLKPQIRWTMEHSDRIVSVSGAMAQKITEFGIAPDKIVVQHNGVDGKLFSVRNRRDARKKLALPADEKLIVFVGNLCPEKGIPTLISAVGCMQKGGNGEKIRCAIIGDGEMREELQHLGRGVNIMFCGRLLPEEVAVWLNACDVFCLPSNREGCPNVILEALASGRPVVASDVGGIPELVNSQNGFLFKPGDVRDLAAKLRASLEKEWDEETLRSSVPHLSWESVARMYRKLFEEVVHGKPTDPGLRHSV